MTALELSIHVIAWLGLACWVVCFIWMHRISTHQERVLKELREMARRIEHFSRVEHDLIREVHPRVKEIEKSVEDVATAVQERAGRK